MNPKSVINLESIQWEQDEEVTFFFYKLLLYIIISWSFASRNLGQRCWNSNTAAAAPVQLTHSLRFLLLLCDKSNFENSWGWKSFHFTHVMSCTVLRQTKWVAQLLQWKGFRPGSWFFLTWQLFLSHSNPFTPQNAACDSTLQKSSLKKKEWTQQKKCNFYYLKIKRTVLSTFQAENMSSFGIFHSKLYWLLSHNTFVWENASAHSVQPAEWPSSISDPTI